MLGQIRGGQFAVIARCDCCVRIARSAQNGIRFAGVRVDRAGYNDFLFERFAHVIAWNAMILAVERVLAAEAVASNQVGSAGRIGSQVNAAAETQTSKILVETVAFVRLLLVGAVLACQAEMGAATAVFAMQNARTEAVATHHRRRRDTAVLAEEIVGGDAVAVVATQLMRRSVAVTATQRAIRSRHFGHGRCAAQQRRKRRRMLDLLE